MGRIEYVIKANATKRANADYFAAETKVQAMELKAMLEAAEWMNIEIKEIKKRDSKVEGVLKRCSLGSENERRNLRILFNEQEEVA